MSSITDELFQRLLAVSGELASLKTLADSDRETAHHVGNIDMAESYVDASVNSMRSR
jgi:hypothetical protein